MNRNSLQKKTVLFCGPIDKPLNSGRYMIPLVESFDFVLTNDVDLILSRASKLI
jgi:hypothetical protein